MRSCGREVLLAKHPHPRAADFLAQPTGFGRGGGAIAHMIMRLDEECSDQRRIVAAGIWLFEIIETACNRFAAILRIDYSQKRNGLKFGAVGGGQHVGKHGLATRHFAHPPSM